jgi:hypothetical protein
MVQRGRNATSQEAEKGAANPVDGIVTVAWTASESDGDSLGFEFLASRDGGQTSPVAGEPVAVC